MTTALDATILLPGETWARRPGVRGQQGTGHIRTPAGVALCHPGHPLAGSDKIGKACYRCVRRAETRAGLWVRTDQLGDTPGVLVWARPQAGEWVPAEPGAARGRVARVVSVGGGPAGSDVHIRVDLVLRIDGVDVHTHQPAGSHWRIVREEA